MIAVALRSSVAQPHSPAHEIAVAEVQALRHLDVVAMPELAEPAPLPFFDSSPSGDQLRLPILTRHDGPTLRGAIARVLAADTSQGGAKSEVLAEARMHRVLTALSYAQADILRRAQTRG